MKRLERERQGLEKTGSWGWGEMSGLHSKSKGKSQEDFYMGVGGYNSIWHLKKIHPTCSTKTTRMRRCESRSPVKRGWWMSQLGLPQKQNRKRKFECNSLFERWSRAMRHGRSETEKEKLPIKIHYPAIYHHGQLELKALGNSRSQCKTYTQSCSMPQTGSWSTCTPILFRIWLRVYQGR